MILLDTSGLLAALFDDQRHHQECADVLRNAEGPLILSPFVLAETDYLIQKYAGVKAEIMFLEDVERGAYKLVNFVHDDMQNMRVMVTRYKDLNIGITDASLIVLADRFDCRDVLTLDIRHFRATRPTTKKSFRILPADL